MQSATRYLMFGLLVLSGYWFTVQRGFVYFSGDGLPSPPGVQGRAGSIGHARPTFWSTGYQGGK